jgi:hypothetical protein
MSRLEKRLGAVGQALPKAIRMLRHTSPGMAERRQLRYSTRIRHQPPRSLLPPNGLRGSPAGVPAVPSIGKRQISLFGQRLGTASEAHSETIGERGQRSAETAGHGVHCPLPVWRLGAQVARLIHDVRRARPALQARVGQLFQCRAAATILRTVSLAAQRLSTRTLTSKGNQGNTPIGGTGVKRRFPQLWVNE